MNQLERRSFTSRVHHQRVALFDVPSQELLSWEVDRQPAHFEEDPRLRHQQNLPSSPARLKIAVSLRRLGERIRMFQPQLQRPLRNPLQYLTGTNL
jgi:hypothetical protein